MPDAVVDTHAVDHRDREAFWHSVLSDTFAPIHLDGWSGPREPAASLGSTRRGRLLLVEHEATAQVHRRTAHLIRRSDNLFLQIAILTSGSATLEQEGRVARLGPGDVVVYENSRPFTWRFATPWTATGLCIPADAVQLTDVERRSMSARTLSGRTGLSGVVSRFVLDLTRHAADIGDDQAGLVLGHASDLAVSLLAGPTNPERADARARTLLERAKGCIAQQQRDPGLTPDQIAAALHISTRYLHKLFEGEHETVALYLRGLRLRSARDELLDPRTSSRSVATVAHGCGFGDVSGFNRAFKAAYGTSPGELRRSAHEGG